MKFQVSRIESGYRVTVFAGAATAHYWAESREDARKILNQVRKINPSIRLERVI